MQIVQYMNDESMKFALSLNGDVIAFGGGESAPTPAPAPVAPPPPEKPKAAPTVDTAGDEAEAAKKARIKAEGRDSTILTSGSGVTSEATTNKKMLLGQ